ncbi:peptide deformylase [Arenimonas sp.]|nr:peptide deformylase [Candidatus Parcubacteria bacterium]
MEEIIKVGNPILTEKTVDADFQQGVVIGHFLIKVLKKYREKIGWARGLAAPQIGENKSVFITFVDDTFHIYINPRILKKSVEQNLYREGCLSCAPFCGDVKRSKSITMEYVDEYGNFNIKEYDGFIARLLQHEYDHLEGILNIEIAEVGTVEEMNSDSLLEKMRDVV